MGGSQSPAKSNLCVLLVFWSFYLHELLSLSQTSLGKLYSMADYLVSWRQLSAIPCLSSACILECYTSLVTSTWPTSNGFQAQHQGGYFEGVLLHGLYGFSSRTSTTSTLYWKSTWFNDIKRIQNKCLSTINASQQAKMLKYISVMSPPWNL